MRKFLRLGMFISLVAPIAAVVSCNNVTKKAGQNNQEKDELPTKPKAKFSENQEYFEITGYDPKRPLSEYNKLLLEDDDAGRFVNRLKTSLGNKSNILIQNKSLWEKNKNIDHWFNITWKVVHYNDGKPSEYIPYLQLYDFAHDYELKEAKEDIAYDSKTNTWSNGWHNPFPYSK